MFDVGLSELIVVGAVALIAIGPKDMPKAMYALGKLARKARTFALDMHRMLEQASREAEIAAQLEEQKKQDAQDQTKKPESTDSIPHDQP